MSGTELNGDRTELIFLNAHGNLLPGFNFKDHIPRAKQREFFSPTQAISD